MFQTGRMQIFGKILLKMVSLKDNLRSLGFNTFILKREVFAQGSFPLQGTGKQAQFMYL